ncbi:MAG: T9SS type A sorting domain-containing protein [Ignavibacteria bacterium]|nr:T9SS type A sorting domain-containing protein [Ignavibacteria bacterium]
MKTILSLAIVVLLFGTAQTTRSQFILKADKETITINAGETATFKISFTILNGFDASIFLGVTQGNLQMLSGGGTLSTSIVNIPYDDITLTVTTTAFYTRSGLYEFSIYGSNSSLSSSVRCSVNVVGTRSNWRLMPEIEMTEGVPSFITQDPVGNYWYQYYNGLGLQKTSKDTPIDRWQNGTVSEYGDLLIPPLFDTKNNKLWLSGRRNLVSYNLDNKLQTVHTYKNYPFYEVNSLVIDNNTTTVWAGRNGGLFHLISGIWTHMDSTNSALTTHHVLGVGQSGSTIWVGTTDGLVKFDGTNWTRYTPQNSGMPTTGAKVLAVEENGDVWVGLSNDKDVSPLGEYYEFMSGLAKFDGTTWTVFNSKNSPLHKDNIVNGVVIDKKGNKWIATATHRAYSHNGPLGGAGILKYDNKEWTAYTKENSPLPDNMINWIGLDNDDNVWFHQYKEGYYDGPKNFWGVFNESGLPPNLLPPTSVEEFGVSSDGISITPNPSTTSFTVSGIDNMSIVKLLNSMGAVVSNTTSTKSTKQDINVSDLASGVYFVQVRSATGILTKPIIVSH